MKRVWEAFIMYLALIMILLLLCILYISAQAPKI